MSDLETPQEATIEQDDLPSDSPEIPDEPEPEDPAEPQDPIDPQDPPTEPTDPPAEAAGTAPGTGNTAPFRPQVNQGAAASEEYLRTNLGDDLFNAMDGFFSAKYSAGRQAETASDYYAGQIDHAAPGFLGVQERAFLRQLPAAQQADPAAAVLATMKKYMEKAQQTGDAAGALSEFARDWNAKSGKAAAPRAAPAVLPPSQRVASGGGGATRPVTAAPRGRDSEMDSAVKYLESLGVDNAEAKRYAREL